MNVGQEKGNGENCESEELLATPQELTEDGCPWYAVKLYSLRLNDVLSYFKEQGLTCFVPMEYTLADRGVRQRKPVFRPVVRNLVFIKKDREEREMRRIASASIYKLSVVRKTRTERAYYEILAKEMREFMLMCSPEIEMRQYLSVEEAKLKAGTPVVVRYGPLRGLSGKLVRSSKKYFLLKEIPGIAVMIKVSRWCCVAEEG